MKTLKATKHYIKNIVPLYRMFAGQDETYDFSTRAIHEMFSYESVGYPKLTLAKKDAHGKFNGYFVGKKWMDINFAMWKEDIESGMLFKYEILEDFDHPGIEKFLDTIIAGKHALR